MVETRNIIISGDAAAHYKGTRKRSKKVQGGFASNIPPGPIIPANMGAARKAIGGSTRVKSPPLGPLPVTAPTAPIEHPPIAPKGGLILEPKKPKTPIILAPRVKHVKTRKVRVQLGGFKKRLTKAKIIHKDSREKSIEEIRKLLEDAKLIKPAKEGKIVPESVLRDIYKDYLLLRNKAL